jgi:hypothetical protein
MLRTVSALFRRSYNERQKTGASLFFTPSLRDLMVQQATMMQTGGHLLQVTIPSGATPGTILQVIDPSTGGPVQVQVPPGVYPGQTIQVQVPGPTQQVIYSQPQQATMGNPTTVIIKDSKQNRREGDDCLACLAGACLCCACCELMSIF